MTSLNFLINTILQLYLTLVLLRIWSNFVGFGISNPLLEIANKITNPITNLFSLVLPKSRYIDWSAMVLAFLTSMLLVFIVNYIKLGAVIDIKSLLPTALYFLLNEMLDLLFWLLIIRAILSWVSRGVSDFEDLLSGLTEPLLSPIRRILPQTGGIDFSVMLVLFLIYFLRYLLSDIFSFLNNMM